MSEQNSNQCPNREILCEMGYEDAVEFIEYNTIRSLPYVKQAPVVMYPLHD